jgi:hypothetical protein
MPGTQPRALLIAKGNVGEMGETGGTRGVVVVIRPRYRNQGRCTCGWVGKARLLLSSAKVDALVHAAQEACRPATPLLQPGAAFITEPPFGLDAKIAPEGRSLIGGLKDTPVVGGTVDR